MAEALHAWLAALPAPALARLSTAVLGGAASSRPLAERALSQRLLDPSWVDGVLARLGGRAEAALAAISRAGVPVVRGDAVALAGAPDEDPVELLESHGLVAAVRTGRGMPTHVVITPGLEELVRARTIEPAAAVAEVAGPSLGGRRRRFELALLVSSLARHPPRLTRDGRPHAGDLATLSTRLEPLGMTPARLARELSDLLDAGALAVGDGRACVSLPAAIEIDALYLRLALTELAAPSIPEETLAVVARLLPERAALGIADVLEAAQATLLRDRAVGPHAGRGARRELVEALSSTLSLQAVVLLDGSGHPVPAAGPETLARVADGDRLSLALDPAVAALLRGEVPPPVRHQPGHVQSSFEIVADPSCDPALVARVGVCATLVRADRAAVLRLERESVQGGLALGLPVEDLSNALASLSGRPVPSNVAAMLSDWARGRPIPLPAVTAPTPLPELVKGALAALARVLPPVEGDATP